MNIYFLIIHKIFYNIYLVFLFYQHNLLMYQIYDFLFHNFYLMEINFNKTGTPRLTKLKNQNRETDRRKRKKRTERKTGYVYVVS